MELEISPLAGPDLYYQVMIHDEVQSILQISSDRYEI